MSILRASVPAALMTATLLLLNPMLRLTAGELAGWAVVIVATLFDSWERVV